MSSGPSARLPDLGESNPWVSFYILVGGVVAFAVGYVVHVTAGTGPAGVVGVFVLVGGILLLIGWVLWFRVSPNALHGLLESIRIIRSGHRKITYDWEKPEQEAVDQPLK